MTPLFSYGVDFVLKGFFVRVIIQDKTEDGLNSAMAFARLISQRIMTSGRAGVFKNRKAQVVRREGENALIDLRSSLMKSAPHPDQHFKLLVGPFE